MRKNFPQTDTGQINYRLTLFDELRAHVSHLYESAALYLLSLALGNNEERLFSVILLGEDVHLKVLDATGTAAISVVGKDYNELGEQLVLACLHKISVEQLGVLHLTPLQKLPPILRPV